MLIPQLSTESKRVLQIIKTHGVCNGRQLLAESDLQPEQLVGAVKELVNSELVSASGGMFTAREIGHAYFNIRPSNTSIAEFVLKSL